VPTSDVEAKSRAHSTPKRAPEHRRTAVLILSPPAAKCLVARFGITNRLRQRSQRRPVDSSPVGDAEQQDRSTLEELGLIRGEFVLL
jgi:hypothetical protein